MGALCAVSAVGTGVQTVNAYRHATSWTGDRARFDGERIGRSIGSFISNRPADQEMDRQTVQELSLFARQYGPTIAWGSGTTILALVSIKLMLK